MTTIEIRRARAGMLAMGMAFAAGATACGDDSSTTGAGGGGGSGSGTTATSGTPASTTPSATSTGSTSPDTTSAGTGEGGGGSTADTSTGVGGAGGSTTDTSTGHGGGGGGFCFDDGDFADLFTLEASGLCVVALYDAPGWTTTSYGVQPTWGEHGGLLTGEYVLDDETGVIAGVSLTRWAAPPGVNGDLQSSEEGVSLALGEDADFGGSQFFDVGDGVTGFAYTGSDFANEGGLVLFDELGILENDALIGGFGLGVDGEGFPLYTALGPLFEGADQAGLYGSDFCEDEAFILCSGFAYDQWGDSTGSLAVDTDGNVFAVMTSFDGTQTARGFSATQIEIAEPTEGVDFFTIDGYGTPLAALAPVGGHGGLLVYQATEGVDPVLPIVVPYQTGDGAILPEGEPATLLTPATEGAPVSFVSDDEGRLWVGVGTETGTRFAVLARP